MCADATYASWFYVLFKFCFIKGLNTHTHTHTHTHTQSTASKCGDGVSDEHELVLDMLALRSLSRTLSRCVREREREREKNNKDINTQKILNFYYFHFIQYFHR
jgi:hypothetical protein